MVRKISIKTIISILSAKFTLFLTKTILKGGTTFPGRVALKIDKNILKYIKYLKQIHKNDIFALKIIFHISEKGGTI